MPQGCQLKAPQWVTQGDRGWSWPPPWCCIIYKTLSNSCGTDPLGGTCHGGPKRTRCLLKEGSWGPWLPAGLVEAGPVA